MPRHVCGAREDGWAFVPTHAGEITKTRAKTHTYVSNVDTLCNETFRFVFSPLHRKLGRNLG